MKLPKQLADEILARAESVGPTARLPDDTPAEPTGQELFWQQCRAAGLPAPRFEYRFDDTRKWRFDICFPESRVAVEVQGGLFSGGRHVRGAALLREYEKLNAAAIAGWCVLLVTPTQVEDGECLELVRAALAARGVT